MRSGISSPGKKIECVHVSLTTRHLCRNVSRPVGLVEEAIVLNCKACMPQLSETPRDGRGTVPTGLEFGLDICVVRKCHVGLSDSD